MRQYDDFFIQEDIEEEVKVVGSTNKLEQFSLEIISSKYESASESLTLSGNEEEEKVAEIGPNLIVRRRTQTQLLNC